MEKRDILEFSVLFFLLLLVIIPGVMFVDVLGHEFYHFVQHQDFAEEICVDVNKPYKGHVKVVFPSEDIKLKYGDEMIEKEERNADRFGKAVSIFYLINCIVVFNWIFLIMYRKRRR